MSFEWKTVKLSSLCTKTGSGATPRGGNAVYLEKGEYSLIRSQNVLDFTFSYNGLVFIDEKQARQLNNVTVEKDDILLNITGDSVARVCQIPFQLLPARVNQHVAIIRPKLDVLSSTFLKYFLLNPQFKDFMLGLSSVGGTRNALTKSMIEDLKITLPPLAIQQKIAEILSNLDDKIELNRQMNATLEAMAQTLFKEWFVKPITEGVLPDGWREEVFENIMDAERGLSYKGSGLADESTGIPMQNLNSVYEGGSYKYEGIKYYSGDFKERHTIKPNDVIVTNTEQGHKYMLIGYPAIVPEKYERSIFSHHIYRLRPKTDSYLTSDYIYHLLLQPEIREQIIGFANGTTVNMLKIQGLQKPIFKLPPQYLIEKFTDISKNMRLKQQKNIQEIQTLKQLRDSLLPKLLRGDIVV